ncbi:hypothetical protein NF867_11635 [Solitalea sp. MAHUQ-68]|uniref:Uncharacterized protein n=1 Tax=Solitalea agri TaxID=2953739 RepID=A0A9X2JFK3_9SPHI|nr:hypothetical protein [Solitalea agri]MCO4293516.1 hypothetical protein [Solitalea agri]
MKHSLVIAITFFILSDCTSFNKKNTSVGKLHFDPVQIQSKLLDGTAHLEGDLKQQKLLLEIKLENNGNTDVDVEDLDLETMEGYQAKLIGPDIKQFTLRPATDTLIILQFKPINDIELYMQTGESGKFKPIYNLSLVCVGNENDPIKAHFNVLEQDFAEYEKNYRQAVVIYKFNTDAYFTEKQKEYLRQHTHTSPFVHLSNQEIAVSGLNFRLQSFQRNDTLYAQVFIVNHAEFPIKVNSNNFDIVDENSSIIDKNRTIQFKKIAGQQEEATILRKGDRGLINLSKYLKGTDRKRLRISFKNTFFISNDKSLFYENPELVKL